MAGKTFETGVGGYVWGKTEISVPFPVTRKGEPDVCCDHCRYLSRTGKYCQLNKEIVYWPEKYIGDQCPLVFDESELPK